MKIEVALAPSATSKEKGDLLEFLTKKLLSAQSYEVIDKIRFTAVELDLLCRHKVNGKEIYVECKAYRDKNIDAGVLKNLAGTLVLRDYAEAWLISTASYGKEAKGFIEDWKKKPSEQATRLSFYDSETIIESLINSGVIKSPPKDKAAEYLGSENYIGEWILLITKFNTFWIASTLSGGIPSGVICFYANDNQLVNEDPLLTSISETDTSLNNLDFRLSKSFEATPTIKSDKIIDVVQVQTGDEWSDYRPARPKDFVGRKKDIKYIFDLFRKIKSNETNTRIFAITGNSGMGKSSLIAKLINKAENHRNKNKYFLYAVDVRAATSPEYIYSALLKCLMSAQRKGFGDNNINLMLTDASSPLNSQSIEMYLRSIEENDQLIALIFDQFEELYSKQELFNVFDKAKSLLLSASAIKQNFCLGFAWKTDSTTHSEHPAYFLWHQLADYRVTIKLAPLSDSESVAAINLFEKEIDEKLHNDLKHNLIFSSQGYPWLLKKLCIHLYENIKNGIEQNDLLENKLDIANLFQADLEQLAPAENACLKFIAQRAPVDWFEVIEVSGPDTLKSLIDRRLVVKSGDRLNLYWDIFKEYVLTGSVPIIPLRYIPSNDFSSILKVARHLEHNRFKTLLDLVKSSKLLEGTVQNICADIVMFGIATRENSSYILSKDLTDNTKVNLLRAIREKFRKHALTLLLKEKASNSIISLNGVIDSVKDLYPDNKYADKTWHTYTLRLCRWLEICGLIQPAGNGWIYKDHGDVLNERRRSNQGRRKGRRKGKIFTAPTSPALSLEALTWLKTNKVGKNEDKPKGYRNALYILTRFELATLENGFYIIDKKIEKFKSYEEAIWISANSEDVLLEVMKLIEQDDTIAGIDIGEYLANKYELSWTKTSKIRNGNSIKQWAQWLLLGKQTSTIPKAPGRI